MKYETINASRFFLVLVEYNAALVALDKAFWEFLEHGFP